MKQSLEMPVEGEFVDEGSSERVGSFRDDVISLAKKIKDNSVQEGVLWQKSREGSWLKKAFELANSPRFNAELQAERVADESIRFKSEIDSIILKELGLNGYTNLETQLKTAAAAASVFDHYSYLADHPELLDAAIAEAKKD